MFPSTVIEAAKRLSQRCAELGLQLVFAESCTGGLIGGAVTAIPGASRVVDRGFVVYSYESKSIELGVPISLIERDGAVSESVAIAMAKGALHRVGGVARLSIATTGVAGPTGTLEKPAGLVHIAVARPDRDLVLHERHNFPNIGRDFVRMETVLAALKLALRSLAAE